MILLRRRAIALVAAAATALTPAACSAQREAADPRVVHMVSEGGQQEVLLRPPGQLRGLVVFMHGLGADQDQLLDDEGLFPLRDALLRAGFAIVTSAAHGDNAGNPASVADQLDAAHDARARLDGVARVDIVAFSMGGLDALLTAASHRMEQLHSVALLSPAVDQRAFVPGKYADVITRAFGNPAVADVADVVRASDPLVQPATDYTGYAYHFWHSPDDTVVPAGQSTEMVDHLGAAGIDAGITALTGDHGDLTALDPAAVIQLFDTSAT